MGKTCPKCSTPDADFGPNKARKDGLAVYCRTCTKAYMLERGYDKARWQENREVESERNRQYRQGAAGLKAHDRERAQRRRLEAPSIIRALNIARKHGERRATPVWADRRAMDAVYVQAKRLEAADGVPRHVDHDVPLKHPAVCGLHVPANLKVLTAAENMAKHNSFVESW